MNAVVNALKEIKLSISPELLQIGFVENFGRMNHIVSLDERIKNSVIKPIVIKDCNLSGGVIVNIPVDQCRWSEYTRAEYIIEVPKSLTDNRSINNVLSLVSNTSYVTGLPMFNTSSALTQAQHLMDSLASINVVQTTRLELIGENTILVQDPSITIFNTVIRAELEYDEMMSNLHPRSIIPFAKLCVLATKRYIYNYLKIKLDQGYIYAGHELGKIVEEVDSFSDAAEQYEEYLRDVIRKILFMNHPENMSRFIQSMLGNTL